MGIDLAMGTADPNATVDKILAGTMDSAANVIKNGVNLFNTTANMFTDSRSNVQPMGGYPGMYGQPAPQPFPGSYAYAYGDTNPNMNPYFGGMPGQPQQIGYPGIYNPNYGMPTNGFGGI